LCSSEFLKLGCDRADGAGFCNADAAKRLHGGGEFEPGAPAIAGEESVRRSPIKSCLRLVCARLRINDGLTGRWNQSRIPGILMRGTESGAAVKAQ
jgi:hypothetical protein